MPLNRPKLWIILKKSVFTACVLTLLLGASCRKNDVGFDMTYRRQFEIPVGLDPFQSHNYVFNGITPDTSAFFQANNTTKALIQRITPRGMNLRASFGGLRYDFISRVEVWISDPSRPNLTPQIIFFRDEVPLSTGERLDLIPNDVDVRPFLLEGSKFTVRINVQLREITPRSFDTEWNISFFAKTG